MAYFTAPERPAASDTALDQPAINSGDTATETPALPPTV
jgi:hypothetical protein